ncbi:nucleotide sugar dehydrogenase, partial [Arthrobacter sp. 2YAF22_2]|uniref:nucleotide sugar dehydrogenase n=1 Tax=Arthrobacter sp. 2YAF22_2 TaxID=3233029 RepID=UPI003F907F57
MSVVGVDVNSSVVDAVNAGKVPFVEPDLGIHVAGAVSQGALIAQTTTPVADAYIVAVPTPFADDKSADLRFVRAAAQGIAPMLRGGELIILESTSPPGTTAMLADFVLDLRPDLSLDGAAGRPTVLFAHCPERVLPGRIMIELVTNDRIVGGLTDEAASAAAALYSVFCQGNIHLSDAATAEMAKLVENAYRDVNIAFANELSVISDNLGINVWDLIELANHHPRVEILQPGPGVGGHCIAVDPWFIVGADPGNSRLIRAAREVNDSKPAHIVDQIVKAANSCNAENIAALGLAFKANIDDVRESPAVQVVKMLAIARPNTNILVAAPFASSLPDELSS